MLEIVKNDCSIKMYVKNAENSSGGTKLSIILFLAYLLN